MDLAVVKAGGGYSSRETRDGFKLGNEGPKGSALAR
jgi:hypothetical protein